MRKMPNTRYFIARKQAAMPQRTRLWQSMRIMREFTAHELGAVCECKTLASVRNFLRQLRDAGYVVVAHRGSTAFHVPQRWRLIRNSGPKCPALVKSRTALWDPNDDQEYPIGPAPGKRR